MVRPAMSLDPAADLLELLEHVRHVDRSELHVARPARPGLVAVPVVEMPLAQRRQTVSTGLGQAAVVSSLRGVGGRSQGLMPAMRGSAFPHSKYALSFSTTDFWVSASGMNEVLEQPKVPGTTMIFWCGARRG